MLTINCSDPDKMIKLSGTSSFGRTFEHYLGLNSLNTGSVVSDAVYAGAVETTSGANLDDLVTGTSGNTTVNTAYASTNNVTWYKVGRMVYVCGYLDITNVVAWNTQATILSGLPPAIKPVGTIGNVINFGSKVALITPNGTITGSTLNDITTGRYAISTMYIAAS